MSLTNDRVGYLVDDLAYRLNTFEARGCPVQPGHVRAAVVNGLVELIEETGRAR